MASGFLVRVELFLPASLAAILAVEQESSQWRFGVGTGLPTTHAERDVGFTSFRGPEVAEPDLTPSDVQDLMKSAFGINAFAAHDRWRFEFNYG